jgi:hypothetical protein
MSVRSPKSEVRNGKPAGSAPRPFRVSGESGRLQWGTRTRGSFSPGPRNEAGDRHDACPAQWTQVVCVALFGLSALVGGAAESVEGEQDAFKLRPPHAELPPTYWEQHGAWTIAGLIVLLVLLGAALWWLLRPKPIVPEPIEVLARRELETLRPRVEDGRVLSQISRVLRGYIVGAFQLPQGEMTTSEFCRAISEHEDIGPALAAPVSDFLRRCDELKFSPAGPPLPVGAAARALELVELGEARRAWLRQQQAATTTSSAR